MNTINLTITNPLSGDCILDTKIDIINTVHSIRSKLYNIINNKLKYKLFFDNIILNHHDSISFLITKYCITNELSLNLIFIDDSKHIWISTFDSVIVEPFIIDRPDLYNLKYINACDIYIVNEFIFSVNLFDELVIKNIYSNQCSILFVLNNLNILHIIYLSNLTFIIIYSDGAIIKHVLLEDNNTYSVSERHYIQNCPGTFNGYNFIIDKSKNNILAYIHNYNLVLYDLSIDKIIDSININCYNNNYILKFSPNGMYILIINNNKHCVIYNIESKQIIFEIKHPVTSIDWITDNVITFIKKHYIIIINITTNISIKITTDKNKLLHKIKYINNYLYTTSSIKNSSYSRYHLDCWDINLSYILNKLELNNTNTLLPCDLKCNPLLSKIYYNYIYRLEYI